MDFAVAFWATLALYFVRRGVRIRWSCFFFLLVALAPLRHLLVGGHISHYPFPTKWTLFPILILWGWGVSTLHP